MKIFFLGTSGWYDSANGNTLCVLIETKKEYIILDAGNGIYKLDRYINKPKPIYLFISHFHLDHVIGLHILAKFNFRQGIRIYGPRGLKKLFSDIIKHPYTVPIARLKTKIKIKELLKKCRLPLSVAFAKLRHPSLCYGYRFFLENRTVAFCTDTGVCRNLYRLAKNADLFIAECSYKAGQEDKKWPHLNPESAARVASEAGAKKLALVHFDSGLYLSLKERKSAEKEARSIFKNTTASGDNTKLELR